MDFHNTNDAVTRRIKAMTDRIHYLKTNDLYFYNQPVQEMLPGNKVRVNGREMGMYASYSYLGLVGHPRINEAAKKAVGTIRLAGVRPSVERRLPITRTLRLCALA